MRLTALAAAVAAVLTVPAAAQAAIPSVFSSTTSPIACTPVASGPIAGARICTGNLTTVPSFDGTPIDVAVALPPAPATGTDGSFPVVGVYPGWSGGKVTLSGTDANTQRWVSRGYAVFSVSPRGWRGSCGVNVPNPKPAACAKGYIHLMHNAYEVRDVQHLLGVLADEGTIDGQKTAATGGSYGGGMSMALGALNDRMQKTDGTLVPWTSPQGKPMRTAAATPDIPWTDLAYALAPNGSTLDYVASSPYRGVNGDRRVGVQKQALNQGLYSAGPLGFYAPKGADPEGDMVGWNDAVSTGGPYDSDPAAQATIDELIKNHSSYSIDASTPPAPMLLSSGWNDDLFPVSETVRYYNKVRARYPSTPIKMFHTDHGHQRSAGEATQAAALAAAQTAWVDFYVRGVGSVPQDAAGGVDVITSACPVTTPGTRYSARTWAALAPGEIRLTSAPAQQIVAPGTAPNDPMVNPTVCNTATSVTNASAATYTLDPAPAGGFTILGSPTVVATTTVAGANDAIIGRLYDVDPGAGTQRLIGRSILRPTGVGAGPTQQVFQLFPQAYKIAEGHRVKLELLAQDSPYARTASAAAPQQTITVEDLVLMIPTHDAPGAAGGLVTAPTARPLPAGYTFAPGYAAAELAAADTPFGAVEQGRIGTTRTVQVTNTGWSADGTLGRVRVTGADRDAFIVVRDECSGETLAAGESCELGVRFAPEKLGASAATLSVPSDVDAQPFTAALTGTGTAPVGGPKGDTGAPGPKGETGEPGPKGETGGTGPKGETGEAGPKGDTGAAGPKGDTGAAGAAGAAGAKGDTGAAGPQGAQGAKGDAGAAGAPGAQGPKGDKGDKGDPGLQGATGPRGPSARVTCTPRRVRNTVRVTCTVRVATAKGAKVSLRRGGRTVATATVRRGARTATLNVSRKLTAGTYTVRVTTASGRTSAPLALRAR